MASLEAIVSVCSLGLEAPTPARLGALIDAMRRQMGRLGLTGVVAVAGGRMVMVCEGESDRLDDWLAFAERKDFQLLMRRPAPCRELRRWTLLDPRMAGAELEWLGAELARPEPNGGAIAALLAWSAFRQEEMLAAGQGELAWRTASVAPLRGLN